MKVNFDHHKTSGAEIVGLYSAYDELIQVIRVFYKSDSQIDLLNAVRVYKKHGDQVMESKCLYNLGCLIINQGGDLNLASEKIKQAIMKQGDSQILANMLYSYGLICL